MTKISNNSIKIAIVGVGNVGATFAYALLGSGLASQIVLIDNNQQRAEGEAMDLNHAVPLTHSTRIWAGDYADCADAAITVITAGTAQKQGETRLDLVQRNYAIYQSIIPQIVKHNPDGILLIASNPLDVLSYAALKLSGLPANRVIGSGTILDTARFRYLLSQHAGVDPRSVHAFIIGEHGDSEVPVWSSANIAGMALVDYCKMNCEQYDEDVYQKIFEQTRDAAYHIIERKGATFYGIGMGLVRICEAILRGQHTVLSVSTLIHDYYGIDDVYLSLPCVINREGVNNFLRLPLSETEVAGLQRSAKVLKETLRSLGL
ncbi:MAG: L-lactate dehydrogenase [Anaerolineaceae bacterium]